MEGFLYADFIICKFMKFTPGIDFFIVNGKKFWCKKTAL